jgi:hypothetical protein
MENEKMPLLREKLPSLNSLLANLDDSQFSLPLPPPNGLVIFKNPDVSDVGGGLQKTVTSTTTINTLFPSEQARICPPLPPPPPPPPPPNTQFLPTIKNPNNPQPPISRPASTSSLIGYPTPTSGSGCGSRNSVSGCEALDTASVLSRLRQTVIEKVDSPSFKECYALCLAVIRINPFRAPYGQICARWEDVLATLNKAGYFVGKKVVTIKAKLDDLIDLKENALYAAIDGDEDDDDSFDIDKRPLPGLRSLINKKTFGLNETGVCLSLNLFNSLLCPLVLLIQYPAHSSRCCPDPCKKSRITVQRQLSGKTSAARGGLGNEKLTKTTIWIEVCFHIHYNHNFSDG